MHDDLVTQLPRRSVWNGWGDPDMVKPLPSAAWPALRKLRGIEPAAVDTPSVDIESVSLPEIALTTDDLEALRAVVGAEHVDTERLARLEHSGGKSYADLYRMRSGDGSHAPDAVVFPAETAEVSSLLAVCAERSIAVVPFGGGTSVVGGVDPMRGRFTSVISVDLRRLDALISVDAESKTAVLQPGMRGPRAEAALRPHGLTIGHFPQSHQQATVGGYLVTRSAGQASSGYGRFEENVVAATIATPTGTLELGGRTPALATAAGPRLLDTIIGSEGLLGIVTELTVQCHPEPTEFDQRAWGFPSFDAAAGAYRALAQELGHGVMPDVSRLSDADETLVVLGQSGPGLATLGYLRARGWSEPALGVLQWEDTDKRNLAYRQRTAKRILSAHRGVRLPKTIAEHWMSRRFAGPYQRDYLMDRGIFVETLETATTWSNLFNLYSQVRAAITTALGPNVLIQCHVSHLYTGGASLYFTMLSRAEADPLAQWRRLKQSAGDAIVSAGGTITHHHAVGTDHRRWVGHEMGAGDRILRAVKNELDPVGILNPGKLLPDATEER